MKAIFVVLFPLCILLSLHCQKQNKNIHPPVQSGILDLTKWNFEGKSAVALNGEWEFYWMEYLKLNQMTVSKRKWISVPSQWQDSGFPALGYATYRLQILLPANPPDLAIDMRSVACTYEVYVNGELVGEQGKIGTNVSESIPFLKHSIHQINSSLIKQNKSKMDLYVYVSNFHYFKGGLWDTISLGSKEEVIKAERKKFIIDLCVLNCLLIMGFYHLGLYLTRRQDKSPLYFACFVFIVALRTASINDRLILDVFPFLGFIFVNKIEYFTVYISGSIFLKFVESLFPDESRPKISKWIHLFFLPPALLVIFSPMYYFGQAVTFVEFGILVTIIYIANMLIKALRLRRVGAKLFISGFVILACSAIHDILKGKEIVYTPYTLGYGLTTFIIFQAAILTRKYAAAFIKTEELAKELTIFSKDLEEKVLERTAELQASLEQVKNLKLQQDGDYFLTSQLLKPLNSNKAKSENIEIEFLTSQKKKFQFRDWQEEIGGDLCMSNQIILRGKKYTVFVNADAMGKSLQGASGALVFGSVFESIINRNQMAANISNIYPEKWIKDAFIELHRVFETFDGSMLVSLAMGLLDEDSGFLYMINADHPASVLFRDGKASFIGQEKTFRKLGTLGANEVFSIYTTQLFPGDILVLGSDGRDDLLLNTEDGSVLFNENDSLFLKHVEESNADLKLIFKKLMSIGSQYDDLTLIRLTFKNRKDSQEIYSRHSDSAFLKEMKNLLTENRNTEVIHLVESKISQGFISIHAHKLLFQSYLRAKNYQKAVTIADVILEEIENETEILFQISYAHKKNGNYVFACELGERIRLREPNHIRNLLNLVDLHYLTKNKKRAFEILDLILILDPTNVHALKRSKRLNG